MANQLTTIVNQLISLIKTNYPRFKDKYRIELIDKVRNSSLGYEDCIIIVPKDTETAVNLTAGKIINYVVDLVYFKKQFDEKITNLSNFAESLDSYLLGYIHYNSYWTHLSLSIDYNIEEYIPENYSGDLGGFVMTITFVRYKPN